MKKLFSLSLLTISLCTFAQTKNYAETDVKWSKTQVTVCWGSYADRFLGMAKFDMLPSNPSVYLEYSLSEKIILRNIVKKRITG